MDELIRELKREIEALKKEIVDIKVNYLTPEKLTSQLEKSMDNTTNLY